MVFPSDLAGLFRLRDYAKQTRSGVHIQLVFRRTPGDKMGMDVAVFVVRKG
jgi:hypothetical protein